MAMHNLKIIEPYYTEVKKGIKKFEVRKNDRDYKLGDILILSPYDAENKEYINDNDICCLISYILKDNKYVKDGYCILGIILSESESKIFFDR